MTSSAEITFGALAVLSPTRAASDYTIDVCADETDYGNPTATVAEVASMLMDGEKAEITRYGNRTAVLNLRIQGISLDAVAAGTAAVEAEVNRGRNTLTWLPPGWSTASVFDVVYSTLDFKHDDLAELRVTRYFTLTLYCLPFARRAEMTRLVAAAVSGSPTVTSIDACTSATGWSATGGAGVGASGGAVVVSDIPVTPGAFTWITRSGLAVSVAADEFVRVDIETALSPTFNVDGIEVDIAALEWITATRRLVYLRTPSTIAVLSVGVSRSYSGASDEVKVHDVSKVDELPGIGTTRQRSFTAEVAGTARTEADIILEAGAGVGAECIVYTAPAGAALVPPLRKWATTTDATDTAAVSGKTHFTSDGSYDAEIPANLVPPGTYLIVARVRLTSAGPTSATLTWWANLVGAPWVDSSTVTSGSIAYTLTNNFVCCALGVTTLPPSAVDPGSAASVGISVDADVSCAIDDVFLFNLDSGVLSWLTNLTVSGTTPSKIEIRSATIDRDRPQWMVGTAGTDADNADASSRSTGGVHQVAPGLLSIYVMTPGATDQTVALEFYERSGHHIPTKGS